MFPKKQDAYYFLGTCYKDMGSEQKAVEAYNKALAVEPDGGYSESIREEMERYGHKIKTGGSKVEMNRVFMKF